MSGTAFRKTGAAAMAAAAVMAVSVTLPAPAQAYVGKHNLKNYATGRCLDSNWDGAVYTLPCAPNGTNAHQMWEPLLQYRDGVNPDIVVLRNDATGRCLARINSTGELRTIVECDDNDSYATVEWYAQGSSWKRVIFSHWYGNTSYAVDSNFTGGAYAQAWNGGLRQQWNFKS
ncbi:RICIN domain-containing protein [Microbispora amethystogenes]|uniref:Ricin B lectin domain-containing protein n=1 Tax=Microbispora amethystogenes TaxID=1427754 RepID=A0ABQ4F885_9ACTN|nr:hypothetical protein [Microbispora amethystogenes]GIH31039.1 hypothetical protein Mam01_12030 [Microbispora amethystogenes]